MKYQRTRKAVLLMIVSLLGRTPTKFGKIFLDWAMGQIERDYPLFHWALNKKLLE